MFRPLTLLNRNRSMPSLRDDDMHDPFFAFYRDMSRLFDDFSSDFGAPAYFTGERGLSRPINVDYRDLGKMVVIEAELPGVDEDHIDVQVSDNLLTISTEQRVEKEDKDVSRKSYREFHRAMTLPFELDPDAIEATFKNGVLKLVLPKPPEVVARTKKIEVRRG